MKTNPEQNHAMTFHKDLCLLTEYSEYYSSNIESVLLEYNYLLEGGSLIFNEQTIGAFRSFLNHLRIYEIMNDHKADPVLRLVDDRFIELLETYLLPLIRYVEQDLKSKNLKFEACRLNVNRPSYNIIYNRLIND